MSSHIPHMFHMYRRGPSRIFWFLAGAGTSAWFMRHPSPRSICGDRNRHSNAQYHDAPSNAIPNHTEHPQWSQAQWEQNKEKMTAMREEVTATAGEFSEAALDTILSTLTQLKTKIGESRAQQEKPTDQPPRRLA
ncbi:hypothetical protein C8J56DRAFT_910559 [Mycena floridula]|nr:hypothetical protein C8J56DRAFT_910559 [Mycena floridula]